MTKAVIVGIAGTTLSGTEAALLRAHPPAGVILFARNVADPPQLRALTAELRDHLPPTSVIMVDQEGGRVARLKPPHWQAHPTAAAIGRLFAVDAHAGLRAAWVTGALIGHQCAEVGFDVVCAPVLDRRMPGAHEVIGDRAYAEDPDAVARLARAVAAGLLAAGIQPVGKHAPGHGRARVDSPLGAAESGGERPRGRSSAVRRNADLPWMMTAHILYPSLDRASPGDALGRDHRRCHPRADRLSRRFGVGRPGDAGALRNAC